MTRGFPERRFRPTDLSCLIFSGSCQFGLLMQVISSTYLARKLSLLGERSYAGHGEITRVIFYDEGLHISDSENYKPSQNLTQQRLENHDTKVSRNTEHIHACT